MNSSSIAHQQFYLILSSFLCQTKNEHLLIRVFVGTNLGFHAVLSALSATRSAVQALGHLLPPVFPLPSLSPPPSMFPLPPSPLLFSFLFPTSCCCSPCLSVLSLAVVTLRLCVRFCLWELLRHKRKSRRPCCVRCTSASGGPGFFHPFLSHVSGAERRCFSVEGCPLSVYVSIMSGLEIAIQ